MAQFLPVPDIYITKINLFIYNYIWVKKDRTKRNTITSDFTNGGLNMMDLESHLLALKASWVVNA